MIFDFHVHVAYKEPDERYSAKEIVDAMDWAGVQMSLILGNDQGDMGYKRKWTDSILDPHKRTLESTPFLPVVTNFEDEDVANFCAKYPDRLIGTTSVHPNRYRPELKVKRAITELGLKALKIYPHSGFFPNDERLNAVYEICERLGVPVIFHTGIKPQRYHQMKFNNPIFVDDVATNFPGLKIVMCHGGFPFVKEFIAVAYSNPNIWVDITFMNYIERTFREENFAEKTISLLCDLIGPDRLVWGSEGPFMNIPLFGKHGLPYYKEMQDILVRRFDFLSDDQKEGILNKNARKLLGLT